MPVGGVTTLPAVEATLSIVGGETGTSVSLAAVLAEEEIAKAGEGTTLGRVSLVGAKWRTLLLG